MKIVEFKILKKFKSLKTVTKTEYKANSTKKIREINTAPLTINNF